MKRFEWNSLKVGDRVQVHESSGVDLSEGVITAVERKKGSNGVGVRVGRTVLWPARMTVHLGQRSEQCWRCDEPVRG
jgi:hypothetical protein